MPNNQQDTMDEQQEEFVPVFLFTGFLEAGKTMFLQKTLSNERFNHGEKMLVLLCEEGIEELDLSGFPAGQITVQPVEKPEDLNAENMEKWLADCGAERVLVEYNGMWQISHLMENLPDDWAVYQAMCFVDATTFMQYNANMRSLVVDKLGFCEMVYFNRFTEDMVVEDFHQIVRGISRSIEIYYEYTDGRTMFDDIEDPLPFDVEADHITIEDRDYALFFRDLMEDTEKYVGKTVTFKGMAIKNPTFPKTVFAVGRYIMTCCIEDTQFCWLAAHYDQRFNPHQKHWILVTGKIEMRRQGGKPAPTISVQKIEDAKEPEQEVATFY